MDTTASPTTPPDGTGKADPDTLALRASPRPVTRLNQRMLAAIVFTGHTNPVGSQREIL